MSRIVFAGVLWALALTALLVIGHIVVVIAR